MASSYVTRYMENAGLSDWWKNTFSDQERRSVETFYSSPYEDEPEFQELISWLRPGASRMMALASLAASISHVTDRATYDEQKSVAYRFASKARTFQDTSPMNQHRAWETIIWILYWNRDIYPEAMEFAIDACEQQIAIAPQVMAEIKRDGASSDSLQSHKGFAQLSTIREKDKRFEDAILLAQTAKAQGWAGDWDKQIERCRKRLTKR